MAKLEEEVTPAANLRPVTVAETTPNMADRRDHGDLNPFTFIAKPYRLADLAKALRAS